MFGGDSAYCHGNMTSLFSRDARIARGSAMSGGDLAYCRGNMGKFFPGVRGLREGVQCLRATLYIVVVI